MNTKTKGGRPTPEDARIAGAKYFAVNGAPMDETMVRAAARDFIHARLTHRKRDETADSFASQHTQLERSFVDGALAARDGDMSGSGAVQSSVQPETSDRREIAAQLEHAAAVASETFDRIEEAEALLLTIADVAADSSAAPAVPLRHIIVMARAGARLVRYAMTDLNEAHERFSLEAGRYEN